MTTTTVPMSSTEIIAAAIEFNRDCPELAAEIEKAVRAGQVEIDVSTQAPGLGHTVRVIATLVVRTAVGPAQASEPQLITLRARRSFTADKMAAWWGRKNFGDWHIRHRALI